MAKKLCFLLSLCLILLWPASFASGTNVVDKMGYLSEEEISTLQTSADNIKENHGLEPVIVITDDMSGKSSMAYADDYFDYNGYGVGEHHEGILFLINMADREIWISTTGPGTISRYDDYTASMVAHVTPFLKDGDYYGASKQFLKDISEIEENAASGKKNLLAGPSFGQKLKKRLVSPVSYLIALGLAGLATLLASLSMKSKVSVGALSYEKKESFKLSNTEDTFLRENVIITKIEKKSSSSSSSHTGSSGRSHGGSGGSF